MTIIEDTKTYFRKLFGMKRVCTDCDGRGRWQDESTSDGLTTLDTHYCETCKGKGYITSDEDIDDFDLAGVGATEGDDND